MYGTENYQTKSEDLTVNCVIGFHGCS